MGLVKTRRLAAMRPPSPSAFAKATADERRTGKLSASLCLNYGEAMWYHTAV